MQYLLHSFVVEYLILNYIRSLEPEPYFFPGNLSLNVAGLRIFNTGRIIICPLPLFIYRPYASYSEGLLYKRN